MCTDQMLELEIHLELFYMKHQCYFYVKDAGQKYGIKKKEELESNFGWRCKYILQFLRLSHECFKAKKKKKKERTESNFD